MSIMTLRAVTAVIVGSAGALVYCSSGFLPEMVASNFEAGGRPTSFNSRDAYRALMTTLTVLAPIFVYGGTGWLPRIVPSLFWLPHTAYGLSAERRGDTLGFIERFGLVISCVVTGFALAMHAITMRANFLSPPHFELWLQPSLLVAWTSFIFAAAFVYHHRFRRTL